ncbi:toll/interleukin-1 receptor domain-containing protein [Pedococcus soli]
MGPYDVFISYAHSADAELAAQLQRGLQSLARPWHRRSALRVFRDETGLSANPGLWTSISAAMAESQWLVLLASPEAARSVWVDREVEQWLRDHDANRILAVVTGGTWAWDPVRNTFDESSDSVPPSLLHAFTEEPRHVDMRWAAAEPAALLDLRHPRFREQVAEVAAPVHGVTKDDLTGEDVRQYRRTRRLAGAAVASLVALLLLASTAAVVAYVQSGSAQRNETLAVSARLTAEQAQQRALDAADLALTRQAEAEASAKLALQRKSEAEASARLAIKRKSEADAAAAEAQRQRGIADDQRGQAAQSAAEAVARRTEAERQTVLAEEAATRADAAATEANRQRSNAAASAAVAVQRADEARKAQQKALALANDLSRQAQVLSAQNAQLIDQANRIKRAQDTILAANVELTGRSLLSAAQARQAEGQHDVGLLLHAQALTTGAQAAQARVSLATELAQTRAARYLPGPETGGDLVSGRDHVATGGAASTDQPGLVWDLRDLTKAPVRLQTAPAAGPALAGRSTVGPAIAGRAAAAAFELPPPPPPPPPPGPGPLPPVPEFARQVALHGFDATGTRLVGVTADLTLARVWDATTGAALLDVPTRSQGFAPVDVQLSPDGRTALVQTDTEAADAHPTVVAVDLARATVVRSWSGWLRTARGHLGTYREAADASPFAKDGHHFLYLDGATNRWAVGDTMAASTTPLIGSSALVAPRFSEDGTEVLVVVESGYFVLRLQVDDGTPVGATFLSENGAPAPVLSVDRDESSGMLGALLTDGRLALFFDDGRLFWSSSGPACPEPAGDVSFDSKRFDLVASCTQLGRPIRLVVVPLTAPNNLRDWPLDGTPVTDVVVEFPETWAVLGDSGTIVHFPYHGALSEFTEPRLGLTGPCAVRRSPHEMVCGGAHVPLTGLSNGADPEVVVPGTVATSTTLGTGDSWYAVTATGRVVQVDPTRPRPGATLPDVTTTVGFAVTPDSRWMVSSDTTGSMVTDLTTGQRVRAQVKGAAELVGRVSVPGRDPAVVLSRLEGVDQNGAGFSAVVDARTGRPWELALDPLTVAAPGGTALASLANGAVTVRTGSSLSTVRSVPAPDAGGGPATTPDSRSWLAVRDGGATVAYIGSVVGSPQAGGSARLVVRDVATGGTLMTAALRSDEGVATFSPQLSFTPDGSSLVMRTPRRVVSWSTASWTRAGEVVLQGACGEGAAPVIDPTGAFVAAGGRLYATGDLSTVDATLGCHDAVAYRNGDLVLLDRVDGRLTGSSVPLGVASLGTSACSEAGRNLGTKEWLQYLPAAPSTPTCRQWPSG